jgi:hypothetical protein
MVRTPTGFIDHVTDECVSCLDSKRLPLADGRVQRGGRKAARGVSCTLSCYQLLTLESSMLNFWQIGPSRTSTTYTTSSKPHGHDTTETGDDNDIGLVFDHLDHQHAV